MLSGFTAVTLIPLADMTSLTFTGPIFVTIGAALLGEAIRIRRLIAIGVGFIGALIILRPGFVDISTGAILAGERPVDRCRKPHRQEDDRPSTGW